MRPPEQKYSMLAWQTPVLMLEHRTFLEQAPKRKEAVALPGALWKLKSLVDHTDAL